MKMVCNNDQCVKFIKGDVSFRIPFVNSGKTKIFYIIEHNNYWGPGIANVSLMNDLVDVPLGGMYTTFDNPFSRHFNSKRYCRYYGVVIPKDKLPKAPINFINLRLKIPSNSDGFFFREVGTHDFDPFEQ